MIFGTRKNSPLRSGALAGYTWLLREPGSGTRATVEQYLAAQGMAPSTLTLGSNGAVRLAQELAAADDRYVMLFQYANEASGIDLADLRQARLTDTLTIREHGKGLALGQCERELPRARFEPPGVEAGHVVQEKAEMLMRIHTLSILVRPYLSCDLRRYCKPNLRRIATAVTPRQRTQ